TSQSQRPSGMEGLAFPELSSVFAGQLTSEELVAQVPALSAILPFLLLMMVSVRLPLANPSPIFGLAMLFVFLLFGLTLFIGLVSPAPVSLACVISLEYAWHQEHFTSDAPWIPLLWYGGFYLAFTVFPFLFRERFAGKILPWASSALAGPLQFFLIYR